MLSQLFHRYAFLTMLFVIMAWAWLIQANTYMNIDTGWFLQATERMLAGGNYANDFFENNPPWILYLTIPPVLFAKTFALNLVLSMRIYVFSFALVSLGISYYFLSKIFAKSDLYLARLFTVILAFLFLVLPSFEFGQRENLFFILSMPYLLMMEQRVQGREVNRYLAVVVGLLSGLVFILKPYFLMTLFLVEFYHLVRRKNLKVLIRPETLAMLVLLITYVTILGLYHRDYLAIVLPFAARYCYFGTRNLWSILFFSQFCTVCYLSLLFFLVSYKLNRFRSLSAVFMLAWLGFFFSYAIQQEDVYYRLYPLYAMSFLIFMLAFTSYVSTSIKYHPVYLWTVYFALVILVYLKRTTYLLDYYPFYYPMLSLVFLAVVSGLVFYLLQANAKVNLRFHKRYLVSFVFVGCVMMLLPFFQFLSMLEITKNNKKYYVKLVNYINTNIPQKSYYFFATNIPNFMEQDARNASRFSFFWFLPGLIKQAYYLNDKETYVQYHKDKNLFVDMVAEDLAIKKPEQVFVDTSDTKSYLFWRTASKNIPISFDYLAYFKDNKKFQDVWKNYHYLTTIENKYQIYLNPYQYQLYLDYKHVPDEAAIAFRSLYLYLNSKNHVEMAFKDNNKNLIRMEVSLGENQLRGIRHALTMPNAKLEKRDKMVFFNWVLKQYIEITLYKYDIYQHTQ